MTAGQCIDIPVNAKIKVFTLALLNKDDEILLGLKKRGLGEGLWNGFGGKVDPGEEIVDAAVREVKEECGLTVLPTDMENLAVIHFEFVDDPVILEVHVFKCSKLAGVVEESDEMSPKWFPRDNVPHSQMWPDDEVWYPLYLSGTKFRAYFLFQGYKTILSYIIRDFYDHTVILKEKKKDVII
ncbi:7,8-dihydro-8-oxoguanine triphosphatase [Orchesella cincta]|uniref:Oxidized purine nucleoside triphosphate hydrolase n=1 Tax=Orchesella cincta TaxID=48709 RepID=A0A1D2MTM7_ORCCI|nr:7,8-dihydro-8-oxoguanine triphosphatase [Orchesella cincta]